MNTEELITIFEEIADSEDTDVILKELSDKVNILERTSGDATTYHRLQKIIKVIGLIKRIDDGQSIKDWR